MAERGEGTGNLGGSHSRTTTVPTQSGVNRTRQQVAELVVEGVGDPSFALPLRKRKLLIPETRQSKRKNQENHSQTRSNSDCGSHSLLKRRRISSGGSSAAEVHSSELGSQNINSASSSSLASLGSPTFANYSGQRRSSRGTYPIGFYAEEEQKSLAAFRDRTSELKSKGEAPETVSGAKEEIGCKKKKRILSESGQKETSSHQTQFKSEGEGRKTRNRQKKMTDKKPSWNKNEGKQTAKVKDFYETDDLCVDSVDKQRSSRRHTLPGRPDHCNTMGVTLSKCLSARTHGSPPHLSDMSNDPTPSTSGVTNSSEGLNQSFLGGPKMLDQIMRKIPRKKKSTSEQDLSQANSESPSSSGEAQRQDLSVPAILRKHQEVKRRKSANLDSRSRRDSYLNKEKELNVPDEDSKSGDHSPGGILKSYPLRNRLRLSDCGSNSTLVGTISNNSVDMGPIDASPPVHLMPESAAHLSHLSNPYTSSQSVPSSPSSPGVAFLDTFRRLRESRRLSHEQNQNAKRGSNPMKETKLGTGTWKRGHGVRKSPVASKRGTRGKPLSSMMTSCPNNRTPAQACGGTQSAHHLGFGSAATTLPIPPSLNASNPGLLPHSFANLGAMGNSNMNGGASGSTSASGASSLGGVGGALGGLMAAPGDSESEENEMGRLEALLASRGLPPSLFGALGPRMQHILHRSVSSSISSKAQQLLVGLQATGDESEQLQAVIEMCQLLVMGNEDTLAGFPIKQVTPALITLLNMEHNFDMMNHACRALTYMMEALPRSSAVVVDAVPVFLEKLQVIQCMDVAEQSLTALNMLSRKHSKSILQAHGVTACLTYIDFFSSNAQRAALSITANCFQNLTADEFHFASDSLFILSTRLTSQGDKKCVESVCLAYSRLVDCFQNDPNRLQEIAGHNLLVNVQQLLVMSPPVLSSGTFIMVIRMLSLMCANGPELAVNLLKNNIAETLCYLLTNSTEPPPEQVELVSRSPQEQYEITCLIGELMPVLPADGIFVVDCVLQRPNLISQEMLIWQWQDDRNTWHNYAPGNSKIIESAHQAGEDEISICLNGTTYTIDFHSMQQINDTTGTMRSVLRRMVPAASITSSNVQNQNTDARSICLKEDSDLSTAFIKSLFSLLYEVYSSSAGPAVRYKCLRALLRMVHFSCPDLLKQILKSQDVSSHLATMLSSQDLKIIVGALQMADLLMQKLPQIFSIFFRREGVMHQIKRLCEPDALMLNVSSTVIRTQSSNLSLYDANNLNASSSDNSVSLNLAGSPLLLDASKHFTAIQDSSPAQPCIISGPTDDDKLNSPSQLKISDVLKKKRTKTNNKTNASCSTWRRSSSTKQEDHNSSFSELLIKNTGFCGSRESWRGMGSRSKVMTSSSSVTSNPASSSASGKTSFLSNFNPVRWGKCNTQPIPAQEPQQSNKDKAPMGMNGNPITSVVSHANNNREYIKTWIKDQAKRLNNLYFLSELQGTSHPALTVLNRLIKAISHLDEQTNDSIPALKEISQIVSESDISPFEVIHSGLVRALLNYLTISESNNITGSFPSMFSYGGNMLDSIEVQNSLGDGLLKYPSTNIIKVPRDTRLRYFLHVFMGCSLDPLSVAEIDKNCVASFNSLINKLNGCVNQLEQFPVKVHDLPGSALTGSGRGGSTSAIKFFNTHQLKCNLQRHPDCSKLRQWRGGPVKVDPLALVQAIERYLVIRGYGRLRDEEDDNSEDDNSDEDIDDTLAAVSVTHSSSSHKLQFLIGDQVLPYNMTVYQAVRQFSSLDASTSEADTDSEVPISHSSIWLQTHTIYYRPLQEESKTSSSRKGKSGSKPSPKKKGDITFSEETIFGGSSCVLDNLLQPYFPANVSVRDPSLEVLCLLRVLYALNRHYGSLYPPTLTVPALPVSDFMNTKLTAKANRQLQDPLVIMTGNLPQWLPQIAYACPFLFPFETRQLLFYAVSFDRDRALQRLMDSAPELNSNDSSERVTPRLERRKRTVSREDILKQAETVIGDLSSSRAMLEIQYENEVGTGLGPTLEFYALVSRELQKADLELWRGDLITVDETSSGNEQETKAVKYVSANNGLYPLPISRNMKSSLVNKIKGKYKFLGKFMAKAVMDSRMLDVGLHECVYKWLLGEERSLGLKDVLSLDQDLGRTLMKLQAVVLQKRNIMNESKERGISESELNEKISELTIDGCKVEDLALNFSLPGYPNIELKKGGNDIEVSINNIEQYLQLVVEWLIREGVWKQMEALREGFESVFPVAQLQIFYPEELEQLFCGSVDDSQWDMKQLAECCRPDHGYTHNSKAVKFLLQILSEYSPQCQRSFLQFVTGSPRLPVGGFRSLSPPLTIVRKTFEAGEDPDQFLPSVMTCVNYLKLPDYSTIKIMQEKLSIASLEGQHSFHLS